MRFLQFVVERTLAGEGQNLKEYLIGVEVFDRRPGYDPRVDPIVRVEARRLRAKLAEYYRTERSDTGVRIELPTGTYAPLFLSAERVQEPPVAAPVHTPERSREKTIAVLPFSNLSSEPDSDYFSDGLTEELTHVLTKVPGLRVVAWNSASTFKGRQSELAAAVEQLGADVVLRGSVRRAGGRLRTMAQLLARNGVVLWSESYDRQFEDIFTIQGEIALAIVNALQLQLQYPVEERPAAPNELQAWNLYLLGRYYWNTRSTENLQRSVECFQQAIAADPHSALAHLGLADAYTILADYGAIGPEALKIAEAAARRATELDPRMAEPYATVALIRSIHDWKWDESEALYHRALELNPNCVTARHWFGIDYLAMLGRFEEAEAELVIARRLDPLSSIITEGIGHLYVMWGRLKEAEVLYLDLLRRDTAFTRIFGSIGRLYVQMGEYQRAMELFECGLAREPETPSLLAALGQTYGLAGQRDRAVALLAQLEELSTRRQVSRTCFAVLQLGLGNTDAALTALEQAADRRDVPVVSLGVHPVYDPLRKHPRFRRLLERVNLTPADERLHSYRKTAP